jgi:uncharacterized protein with GYD domain
MTYVTLVTLTEQGIAEIGESPQRAAAFTREAEKLNIKVRETYWTLGDYDGVLIFDAPDEESATAALLSLGRGKNVKTNTLRAFDRTEIVSVLEKLS